MNRLRFRVWDKEEKKFVDYPVYFNLTNSEIVTELWYGYEIQIEEPLQDSNYIVQQSTGLKDKNSTEIFEGDILSISKNHSKIDSGFFSDEKINYEVVFLTYDDMEAYADIEHYGWCAVCLFTGTRCTLIDAVSLWDAEIIGSKFTHPHLLEEE